MSIPIEEHPLSPFLPYHARVLMLGSFPPKREKWSMDFYYPNFQNDMWRIIGLLFFNNKYHFLHSPISFHQKKIIDFLTEKGIAIGDSAKKVRRLQDNASDKFLEVIEPLDIATTLQAIPQCEHIITTGEKSASTLGACMHLSQLPRIGSPVSFQLFDRTFLFHRLPSSSRAYPLSIEKKAQCYKETFSLIFPEIITEQYIEKTV